MKTALKDVDCLLCDAGNSVMKIAFGNRDGITEVFSFPCGKVETADSLGLAIRGILQVTDIEAGQLRACVACSVVPGLSGRLRKAIQRYLGCEFILVPDDLPVPLKNSYEHPEEAGIDRLVAAFGGRRAFPAYPGLVLADFGSVSTFDSVSQDTWHGGLLFPGLAASMEAMHLAAPALPKIFPDFYDVPEKIEACCGTRKAMISGLLHGFARLSDGICGALKNSLPQPVKVVATGGYANAVARLAGIFDAVLPNLALEGLAALYYENS